MEYSKLFHTISKHHTAGRKRYADEQQRDADHLTIQYKSYDSFTKIMLPRVSPRGDIADALTSRTSGRRITGKPLGLDDFGAILGYSCGLIDRVSEKHNHARAHQRVQPSAGALYPLEMYVLNFAAGEVAEGVYHYAPREHALSVLSESPFTAAFKEELFVYDWIGNTSAVCLITGVFARSQDKYGERGYRYMLLEAGHIAQNMSLVCATRDISSCPVGGTYDSAVEDLLDIDGVTESLLYAVSIALP